jgi:hypothetical protein
MKQLNTIVVFLVIVFAFGACDILENQEPRQDISLDQLYNSTKNLESALNGAYDKIQDDGDVMGSSYPLFGSLMGDNARWTGSFEQWAQISSHEMDFTNSQIEDVWEGTYAALNDINLIIEAVDAGNIDDAEFEQVKDRIKGEALFLRGLLYFEMVRMWAKPWGFTADNSHPGVPVVTTGTQTPDSFEAPPRNTVAEVYDQVKTDLNEAINLLSNYTPGSAGRANVYNAHALLARVNLQQGNYGEVASLTQPVVASNFYALEGAPQGYFFTPDEESSSEAVFDIVHTTQDNPGVNNSLSTFYASADAGGRGDVLVTQDYLDAITAATATQAQALPQGWSFEDLRRTQLIDLNNSSTLKYEDGFNTDDNAPVIRYSGVLLMRAEALAETADSYASANVDDAIALLNEVHLRSIRVTNDQGGAEDPTPYFGFERADFTSTDGLLDAIRLERRVELAFEGVRKHDLSRLGLDIISGTSGVVNAPDANEVIWPIPQSELDANNNIEQNPGYGS